MDSKAVKASFKSAVEHIKGSRFKEAIKICREVLKSHHNNSRALALLGKAAEGLGENETALEAYKKATVADDDILPWQGLCNFYEKHGAGSPNNLIEVYEKLLILYSSNEEKQADVRLKLSIYLLTQSSYNAKVCEEVEVHCSNLKDPCKQYKVWVAMAFCCLKADSSEAKAYFLKTCHKMKDMSTFTEEEKSLWEVYARRTYQVESSLKDVISLCISLANSYPSSIVLSSLLVELFCHVVNGTPGRETGDIQAAIQPPLLAGALAELYNHVKDGSELTSSFSPEKLISSLASCAYLVLARQRLNQRLYKKATEFLQAAKKHLADMPKCLEECSKTYQLKITDYSIQLAFAQRSYEKVISICRQEEMTSHREEFIISLIESGSGEEAEKLLDSESAEDKALLGYLYKSRTAYDTAYTLLSEAPASATKSSKVHLWLGQVCLEIASKEKEVAKHLLTAAKLDTENEEAFLYLGYYYKRVGDHERGMKCIKKSYSLNPANDKICMAYVDQLVAQGEKEQVLQILSQTTRLSPSGSGKWAWFRLGSLRTNEGNITEAINCFQQALRADEDDSNCWECLGDCYVRRGSFVAAIHAFEKAYQLNPQSIYSCYQIALTKHKLGLHSDARQLFLEVLKQKADYIPALKGLGDVHVSIAREAVKDCIYGKISENISCALHYLTGAAVGRPDLVCVWKSLGDALTLCYQLPIDTLLICPAVLTSTGGAEAPRGSTQSIDVTHALAIGARCYAQCRHLKVDSSSSWHDLAVNYLYQSKLSTESARRKSLLQAASQFAQKAIALDKSVVAHYNCLGAIYLQPDLFDAAAAQHYLIRSVELDQNNVQGWTNLAALYLMKDDLSLAHEALKIAQSADPKYNECWTGQALVAEKVAPEEAMDLFRHTTELGNNIESALGYTHWVLKTLIEGKDKDSEHYRYSIEKLDAVTVSCNALAGLTAWKPTAQSLNAYGLLLERQGLLMTAGEALVKCVDLAEKTIDPNLSLYRSNLARVLCHGGDYHGCLKLMQQITSITMHDVAITALSHYKLGNYPESFKFYNKLLELSHDDAMTSHVYAAMGMLAVKCDDNDTAKTAFFQCAQFNSPSIYGLAGLCSLALLSGDGELAFAALAELVKCSSSKEAFILKCTFCGYMAALKGDTKSARNRLLSAIHCYPMDRQLHYQLLTLSIISLPDYQDSVLRLTETISSVQDLVAIMSLKCGHVRRALKQAQSALHLNPESAQNWLLLLSASYSACSLGDISLSVITSMVDYIASRGLVDSLSGELRKWFSDFRRMEQVYCEK
ncbi:tetratricopeptide repeat protein 37-like [Watersipora subatra]|uniref:tetratricopeptide repeat protein 37-like n=1 Tax=Watersipora subatra TaxID=2589382 RepID=UPI00355BD035